MGGKGEGANIDDGARDSSCLDVETWKGKRMALDVETWKGKHMAPAGIQQDSHITIHDASQLCLYLFLPHSVIVWVARAKGPILMIVVETTWKGKRVSQ